MQIIQTISMDLAFRGITPRIYGKQDDSGAMRGVRIELFNAGAAYEISSGTTFLLRYKTAQNAIGLYDALPDGSSAFAFAVGSNAVTVTFVDQMFAQPGDVECELRIVDPSGVATTWKWILDVERGNVGDSSIPSDYINAFNTLAASAADAANRAEAAAKTYIAAELGTPSVGNQTDATFSVGIISQTAMRIGSVGFLQLWVVARDNALGDNFEFTLLDIPRALVACASPGRGVSGGEAFIWAGPSYPGGPISVCVYPTSGPTTGTDYSVRFSIVYLIDE